MSVAAGCPVETERNCTSAAPLFQIGDDCFDALDEPAALCEPVMATNRTCGIAAIPVADRTAEILGFQTQADEQLAEAQRLAVEAATQLAIATAAEAETFAQLALAEQAIADFLASGGTARISVANRAMSLVGLATDRQAGLLALLAGFLAVATTQAAAADAAGVAGQTAADLIPAVVSIITAIFTAVQTAVEAILASPSARFFY
ncbi:hypothetical protein I4F81_007647 [Pyropia yezoensis]|uniref:Uncharacterized protein n=1 Tax=Pyropia yezoensis TaxID=2788 RepID=A0ACC3C4M3_PYRYE|nr:hypothetical protein I4F81_007647 [Neopyropia yezoensis]